MAIKKIYSNYQIENQEDIKGLQIRIAELKSYNDDYYIAQRDAFNRQQKEEWIRKIEKIRSYTEEYHRVMMSPYIYTKRYTLALHYFKTYSIDEITGAATLSNDPAAWSKPGKIDEILDPENIKRPDQPIPKYDLQHFRQPIEQQIRELKGKIENIKTETAKAMLASQHKPLHLDGGRWLYQDSVYEVTGEFSFDESVLLILEFVDKERRKFERLKNKFSEEKSDGLKYERPRIPENVRIEVWRRDEGKCVRCGSREKLEYDHIVPISRGGSNTARNIELLCESCNRAKSNNIS